MAEFKLTIADPKTGKCVQKTAAEQAAKSLVGLKIGDAVKGDSIDLAGYEFTITGGSDSCGFPMRKGISGARKKVLVGKGVGFKGGRKGMRRRKTVCGDTINEKLSQINLKITKHGSKPLAEESGEKQAAAPEAKEKKETKAEEKPKEEAKIEEQSKTEESKEEKKEPEAEKEEKSEKPDEKKEG